MIKVGKPDSPRIRRLQGAVRKKRRSAEARFWASLARSRTPIIEPVEDDPTRSWVTYVWRGDARTRSVGLSSPQTEFGEFDPLTRLAGTQVWYRTVKTRNDCMGAYLLVPNPPSMSFAALADFLAALARGKLDPLNPARFVSTGDPVLAETTIYGGEYSVLHLKAAPDHPEVRRNPRRVAGNVRQYQFRSRALKNRRRVWVYTPPSVAADAREPRLVIFFDGFGYVHEIDAPVSLDNLLLKRRILPTYAVFVDAMDLATRAQELRPNPAFGVFLTKELLPWIRRTLRHRFDASHTTLAGFSYGGLCATYWAMRYPTHFGSVLSQSGSFWWAPKDAAEPNALAREFMHRPKLPLKFYLDAGRYEGTATKENGESQLASNRHLRDVLLLRGYRVRYQTYNGGHDTYCWRQTLVDGLTWVLS